MPICTKNIYYIVGAVREPPVCSRAARMFVNRIPVSCGDVYELRV